MKPSSSTSSTQPLTCSNSCSLPSTSNKNDEVFNENIQKISINSAATDDTTSISTNLQTWSMCPMGKTKVISLVSFVCIYSFLFLFFASRSTVILITMTG